MAWKHCPGCGAETGEGDRFCTACGYALGEAQAAEAQAAEPPAGSAETAATAATPGASSGSMVGGILLILLLAAGGGFWFYDRTNAPERALKPGEKRAESGEVIPVQPQARTLRLPDQIRDYIDGLAKTSEAEPENVEAWEQIAGVYYRASQLDRSYAAKAEEAYRHLLGLNEKNLIALRGMGNLAYGRGQPAEAIDYYESYLEVDPTGTDVRIDLGTMRYESGDADSALAEWDRAIEENPQAYQAYFNRGMVYDKEGRREEALAELELAKTYADNPVIKERLSTLLAAAKEGNRSLEEAANVAAEQLRASAAAQGGGAPLAGAAASAGSGPATQPAAPAATVPDTFHGAVEHLFRTAKVAGPRVAAVRWPSDDVVRVEMANFPMEQMPPVMKNSFLGKMKTGLREAEAKYGIEAPVRVEITDQPSGRLMAEIRD